MQSLLVATLLIFSWSVVCPAQCRQNSDPIGETTHQGGNELIVHVDPSIYKKIEGVVEDINGKPLGGVLVEIFDNPEWIRQRLIRSPVEQRRLAVAKTKRNGKFRFDNLPSGSYELRLSRSAAWNVSHIFITVNPANRDSKKMGIKVIMYLGT
jgi:hypothetical protein